MALKVIERACDLRVLAVIKREEKALEVMEGACNLAVKDVRQREEKASLRELIVQSNLAVHAQSTKAKLEE